MSHTTQATRLKTAVLAASFALVPLAGVSAQTTQTTQTTHAQAATQSQATVKPKKHHSVLKGAAVGAIGGHMTHRKHGALVGAMVGAEVQHHRNKKAAKNP